MAIDEKSGNLRRARRLTAILLTRFAFSGLAQLPAAWAHKLRRKPRRWQFSGC
jgi:hypothetical protein